MKSKIFLKIVGEYKCNPDPGNSIGFCVAIPDQKLTKEFKSILIVKCTGSSNCENKYNWTFTQITKAEFTQNKKDLA